MAKPVMTQYITLIEKCYRLTFSKTTLNTSS